MNEGDVEKLVRKLWDNLPGEVVQGVMTAMALNRARKFGQDNAAEFDELLGLEYHAGMIDFGLDKLKAVLSADGNYDSADEVELEVRGACALIAAAAMSCMWELHHIKERADMVRMFGEDAPEHIRELVQTMNRVGESLGIKVQFIRIAEGDDIADVVAKAIKDGDAEDCGCGQPHADGLDAATPADSTRH